MTKLIIGLIIFFSIHSISIFALEFRDRVAAKYKIGWRVGYSLLAVIGLALICIGYGEARLNPTILYVSPVWMYYVAAILLLPVFVLMFAPYFPGVIRRKTRHPMLVSIKLWALAHLLVNGTLADILLFGAFLAWAVADRISMKRRTPRHIPGLPKSGTNDLMVTALGLIIYVIFVFWLHESLIGIDPIAVMR